MSIGQGSQPGRWYESIAVNKHAAADVTELRGLWSVPKACLLFGAYIQPTTAVTGTDTDSTNVNLLKNATEIANKDFAAGTDLVAHTETTLYSNATGLALVAGDHLNLEIEQVGNGLLIPAWTCRLDLAWK